MKIKTACPLDCYDGCSVIATVEDGKIIRLDGNPDHPITRGALCNRGRRLGERRDSDKRILHPMKKVAGEWVQISWERAIREIAAEIQETLSSDGHHAILHAFDWGSGAVLKSLNQRFFYQLGGCTETVGSLCWEAGLEAQRYDFGQARSHAPDDMVRHSQVIVVWGRNVATTNVHMMPFIKQSQARGAKLVVVNPLPTDIARRADFCVVPRPGTDAILALGVLRVCRDKGYVSETFLTDRSIGWDQLAATLDTYTLDFVSSTTDVPATDIERLADAYGRMGPVTTLLGLGMQRYAGGGNAIRAIDALAAATGNVGVPGGGVNYAQRGMASFFDEDSLTGRRAADVREFFRGTQAEEILASNPPIRMMFVTRTNPLTQVPDTELLKRAYGQIPCKVVIDTFMTKTAEMADYFLPCTNVMEEEDVTFTTMWHAYVSYIRPVVPPRGEAKPEWQIFRDLAEAMGRPDMMEGDVSTWLERILSPMLEDDHALTTLRSNGFMRLPIEDVPWADGSFMTPSGKFEFASEIAGQDGHSPVATYIPPVAGHGNEQYPYTLLTIHPRKHENSQREAVASEIDVPVVELSDQVAREKGIVQGGTVRVFNAKASVVCTANIVTGGHPYTVKLESGWWGQGVTINSFTDARRADFGQQTAQYDCACDVEAISPEASSKME